MTRSSVRSPAREKRGTAFLLAWEWLERSVKALRQTLDTEDLKKNISQTGGLLDLGLSYEIYGKLLQPLGADL